MSDSHIARAGRTPLHLWVVGILALLWNAMGAFDYVMTETRNAAYMDQFTPEQLDFFYGFPAWVIAFWAIAVWGGVLGALLLLARRCLAYPVLLVSFVAMIVTTVRNYVFAGGLAVTGDATSVIFSIAIFLIALALVFYARAMCRRGVLR